MNDEPIEEFYMSETEIIEYLTNCRIRGQAQFEHGIQAIVMSHPFVSEERLRSLFPKELDKSEKL